MAHVSPYHAPGFYDEALARGRHRDIVGGRWDETGRIEMRLLLDEGLLPRHRLLDLGCGSLRLGCRAVPYLDPGNYWGTDLSRALMLAGYEAELADKSRLPVDHLVEDADFAFPGIPADMTHVMAFAVFTHLPVAHLRRGLDRIGRAFPALERLLVTVFLAPDAASRPGRVQQPDGVVTHGDRFPYHFLAAEVLDACSAAGLTAELRPDRLPRGQRLFAARPAQAA